MPLDETPRRGPNAAGALGAQVSWRSLGRLRVLFLSEFIRFVTRRTRRARYAKEEEEVEIGDRSEIPRPRLLGVHQDR